MILNLEIAIMTPPYGFALFYMKAFAPEGVTMLEIYKSITPFLIIKFFVLGLVMVFPDIATWLPIWFLISAERISERISIGIGIWNVC